MGLLSRWLGAAPPTTPSESGHPSPLRRHSVQPGIRLIEAHDAVIAAIRQQVGVPQAHWAALYQPLLSSYAAFVQSLPASEAHHHSEPGGMLAHGLQAVLHALTLRRGILLPSSASAEELAEKQDVWTYATATAALLHDIGKPLCDQQVLLFDVSDKALGQWDALAGAMTAPAASYSASFRRGRRYRLHARLPLMLAHHIVPAAGLRWLAADLDVFESWLATLAGGDEALAGDLGKLVRSADGLSVAADLTGTMPQRQNASGAKPLAERMATGLRYLVDQGRLPLNKPGAGGWVADDALWLVSKRALDALREHLLSEGQGGVPSRNDRLMDELQSYGIVTRNGERAIWNATIEQGSWSVSLTLLRVPLSRLWPDTEARPAAFEGRVIPESGAATDAEGVVSGEASERLATAESAAVAEPQAPNTEQRFTETVPGAASGEDSPDDTEGESTARHPPSDFLSWLREGIVGGRLKANTADARVHYVEDGLFLVSPAVFRDFAGVSGWESAQKKLLKLRLHRKTAQDTNIWTYRVVGEKKSGALLRGLLLPDPEGLLGIAVPRVNPVLHRATEPGELAAAGRPEVLPVETP